ncbi:6,7-dimethyl-8-ribityllumazine synthase [Candidatus Peregrinibacteria bacterium]|nr:6,7-dimethyl-8-ribityllumazine synthase [Candidatus Peregrinibacteria bacterium]
MNNVKIAIILSRFHESIGKKLLAEAVKAFKDKKGKPENLTLIRVPGSFEIPLTAKKLIDTKKYDAIITLGVLVKGETYHFEAVAKALVDGIRSVMLETGVPIIFEVLIVPDIKLAEKRAGKTPDNNKGYSAMISALEMVDILRNLSK